MSSTEAMTSSTHSSSGDGDSNNGNGKRGRPAEIAEQAAAPLSKLLKNSDESDEKETASDGRSSATTDNRTPEGENKEAEDDDAADDLETSRSSSIKPVSEAMKDVAVAVKEDSTESAVKEESMESAVKEESTESTTNTENPAIEENIPCESNDNEDKTAEDDLIQIDRTGEPMEAPAAEIHGDANPSALPPSASVDPRVSATAAAVAPTSAVTSSSTNSNTNSTNNPRPVTTNTDPRAASTAAASLQAAPFNPIISSTTAAAGLPMDPNSPTSVSNPEQVVEERGEVSAFYVGRVIGKGGEMIRDLQARSGARIDVDQNVPAGQPRVITYRGTRETVDFAKQLVQMLSTEGVHENDLPLGNASQEYLVIPAPAVGKVIGRGGEMIRELQARSQAKIQIDHLGQSGIPSDQKQVTITGTHEAVAKAKEMVLLLVANPLMDAQQSLNMLIDDKVRRGTKWGSGPPYANLPNEGINMQPHMVPAQFQGMTQGYGNYQPPPAQQYGGGGGYPPHQQQQQVPPYGGAPQSLSGSPPGGYPPHHGHQQQQQQQVYGGGAPFGDGRESDVVYAPKQFMGRIIGGKGVTVNDLQRRSGCDIQINQDVVPGQDCEITLKGTRQGIESAKAMIQEIIEIGPQHPYAGGMDSYGGVGGPPAGAGGGYHGAYSQQQPQYPPYQQHQQQGYEQGAYGQVSAYMPHGGGSGGYGQAAPVAMGGAGYGHHQQPHSSQPYGGGGYAPQPVVPPRQAPLQVSAWKAAPAPDGQIYYYNERTGETQWEKPAGMP